MRYQRVEAIGEVQYLRISAATRNCLKEKQTREEINGGRPEFWARSLQQQIGSSYSSREAYSDKLHHTNCNAATHLRN